MADDGPDRPALRAERSPVPSRAVSAEVELAAPGYAVHREDRWSAAITGFIHFRLLAGELTGRPLDSGLRGEGGDEPRLPLPERHAHVAPVLLGRWACERYLAHR